MLRPVPRPRTKTDEKTLRGRPVWIDETGYVTGEKGSRYSEVSTTIPWGTDWITAPSVDENGSKLSDDEVFRKLKDNQGRDFITGEKLPTFENEPEASAYAQWRSDTMFDEEQIEKGYKPVLEQQQYEEDVEETLTDKVIRKAKPFTDEVKGFVDYLMTPSQHFDEGGLATQTETAFGFTAQGVQQEADKYAEEFNEQDQANITKAAEFLVPFYDSGVNITNVVQEYMKPEAERDSEYIKDQFKQAGQSAAIEGGLLLMGGVVGKYGAKGVKALSDKVKQYEIDPSVASAFGVGSIRKKTIQEGVPTIEAADLTDEAIEAWRKANETSPEFRKALKGRDEELMDLAAGVKEGRVFNTTYRNRADELRPIRKVTDVPKPATIKETVSALDAGKRKSPIVGLNYDIPDGDFMTARLDIPAYTNYDTWVPTLRHSGKTMYKPALRMKNVKFIQPEGKEVRSALDVAVGPKRLEENFGLAKRKAEAKGNKSPFAVMEGSYVKATDDEAYEYATSVFDNKDWTQVGYDPTKRGFFYDRETGEAILEADEVVQVGHLVLAKNAKKTTPDVFPFNKGGMAMKDNMNMGYALGGEVDAIDPVSGNEIPPGSTAKEVRDDIPAMLSEGEYVVPADVLKFYGLKFFEDLRQKAKVEMAMLEEDGRMGGQPTPEGDDLTEDEMRLLDEVMGMAQGGMTQMQPQQPQPPQPMMMGQQMPPPKPQPTEYNKPVGFNTGGMTDAFGNPLNPGINPPPEAPKYLADIDPTSTNVYGIDQQDSPTSTSQAEVGVDSPDETTGAINDGMKTVFYFHKDGRRIQVLMLNGKPISSVPADFSEFKEDTPENRTEETGEIGKPTDDISGGVGQTKSGGSSRKTDDDERRVQAKTIETLKTNAEKKRIDNFNTTLATGKPEDILEEYKKAKRGQGASFLLPGLVGVAGAGLAKKNLNTIEAAYLKRSKDTLGDAFNLEEAQKTLDDISIGSSVMDGITGTFKGEDAMSNLFGKGFYDNYEAKYDVSEYIGMGSSISGEGVKGFVQGGYGNLDARQQQHFDNAVDRGDSAILNHFSLVATSNRAKDQFAIDNADAIQNIRDLEAANDMAGAKAAAENLKNNGYKFGNMSLGNSSMDEVIRLGSSADTAKKLGKAKKEKGFFSKTVTTGDNSPIRTTEPVKDSGPTAQEKADADKAAKDAADKKKADDAAKTKRAEDFRKKENRRAESQGGGDFHSNMVAKAQERQKQTRAGQQAGKGYVGGFGFDKGGLMKRKK